MLPIHIEPTPGQCLASYIESIADALFVPRPQEVLAELLSPRSAPRQLVRHLGDPQDLHLASALDLPVSDLRAMTFARWANLDLAGTGASGGGLGGPSVRRAGCRYCPDCLRGDAAWQIDWYVHWTFVCLKHNRFLHVRCPICGAIPRHRSSLLRRGGPAVGAGDCRSGCTRTGFASAPSEADADPVSVAAQRRMIELRNGGCLATASGPMQAKQAIEDVAILSRLILRVLAPSNLGRDLPAPLPDHAAEAAEVRASIEALTDSHNRNLSSAVMDVRLGLYVMRAAFETFDRLLDHPGSTALSWLPPELARRTAFNAAHGRGMSTTLYQALVDRQARRTLTHRLRAVTGARVGAQTRQAIPMAESAVPFALWPSALATLTTPTHPVLAPAMLSLALLSIGRTTGAQELTKQLDWRTFEGGPPADKVTYWLNRCVTPEAATLLGQLHTDLAEQQSPIDYRRRRRLFTRPDLCGPRRAQAVLRAGSPATRHLKQYCNWFLFELLTGGDLVVLRPLHALHGPRLIAYRRWTQRLPDSARETLHEQAATHLRRRRINEPVTAEPTLAAGRWTVCTSELPQPAASRTSTRLPPITRHLAPAGYVSLVRAGNDPPSAKRIGALLALAEAGTVAAAAAAVGISQSTASNLLLALEGDIGAPLYERGHRGSPATITPVGQQLCRLAELAGLSSHAASSDAAGDWQSVRRARRRLTS